MPVIPRLRIAYVLDVFDGVKTGGVLSAQRFVAALRAHHEVTVVTSGSPGEGRVTLPSFYPPFFERVMREMGFIFAVPRRPILEEVLSRVDVVHVQFPFWLGMRTAALARAMKVPLVAGFHVQPENLLYNIGLRSSALTEWTYRFFLSRFYNLADTVICPSPFALDALVRRGLTARAEVISNGVTVSGPWAAEREERYRGRPLLLAVGRLAKEKRLDVVIEGVRRSRHAGEIQLVITGRGPEAARVLRLSATLPRPAEVGFKTDEELRQLLATSDLLLHASEVELEGMAVLEAAGCGTPALIANSPTSATPQFALSKDFLFRAGDPEDLALRLDHLLDEPGRLAAARADARALAARFDFEESVRRTEAVLLRVARREAPRHDPLAGVSSLA
jgi:glycosyltransferase involved in cell wall biosynthesis